MRAYEVPGRWWAGQRILIGGDQARDRGYHSELHFDEHASRACSGRQQQST
jgi:hypothetical protein